MNGIVVAAAAAAERPEPEDRPALVRVGLLAALACAIPLAGWLFWAIVLRLGPNDFHDYWLAGRLILDGKSPYDMTAMAALAREEHLSFSLGGGYSYPLPFAVAMVPFALLPFDAAVVCFNLVSVAAFGLTVATWLAVAHRGATVRNLAAAAAMAGAYPPIYGTVAMGQANLVLFPLMALGLSATVTVRGRPDHRNRDLLGGALLGLAAIVKLVPAALLAPLALARKWGACVGLITSAVAAMAVSAAIVPWALSGSGGLAALFDPDGYYTNQSINGFVSRLVTQTSRSSPLLPQAFDPRLAMLAATALFGVVTLAVLWRARRATAGRTGLAYGAALALTAATIGAPKTSFWNESLLLVAVALVLAVESPDLRTRATSQAGRAGPLDRIDLALVAVWFGSAVAWALVWAFEPSRGGPLWAVVSLAWSASLYGMLALWLMLARRLLRLESRVGDRPAKEPAEAQAEASSTIS